MAKKCTEKCNTCAELLFCQIKLISFLTFLLPLPSWHLKLPVTSVCLHMSWKKLMEKTVEIWVASGSSLDCLYSKHQHTVIWVFTLCNHNNNYIVLFFIINKDQNDLLFLPAPILILKVFCLQKVSYNHVYVLVIFILLT